MHSKQAYQELNIPQYSEALLLCKDKKTCTNLANELNVSHDAIQRQLDTGSQNLNFTRDGLRTIAKTAFQGEGVYLIADDTLAVKKYAKEIEGLEESFDGSSGRPEHGLRLLTTLLTNKKVRIGIDTRSYVSRELAKSSYKSKGEILIEIALDLKDDFNIKKTLADAHFATKVTLKTLHKSNISFLMKIPCTRIVTIGRRAAQLKKNLRLKRNSHTAGLVFTMVYYIGFMP